MGHAIYSGGATVGRIGAFISAIVATIVGIFLIGVGIYTLSTKNSGSNSTEIGVAYIIGGIILAGLAWLIYYFTRKSKAFAFVEGASFLLPGHHSII